MYNNIIKEQIKKKTEIECVCDCYMTFLANIFQTFTNDPSSLEYIRTTLAIPSAPKLAPISETHTLVRDMFRY